MQCTERIITHLTSNIYTDENIHGEEEAKLILVAHCNDGTIWTLSVWNDGKWKQRPSIPEIIPSK